MNDMDDGCFDGAAPLRKPRKLKEIPDIQDPAIKYARKRGWLCHKMRSETANGFPDFLCVRNALVLFIEFKRPGGKPKAHQFERHKELREHGATVFLIDDLGDAIRLFT